MGPDSRRACAVEPVRRSRAGAESRLRAAPGDRPGHQGLLDHQVRRGLPVHPGRLVHAARRDHPGRLAHRVCPDGAAAPAAVPAAGTPAVPSVVEEW